MRQEVARGSIDGRIARLAARQHGVVSSTQLVAVGVTTSGIRRRVQAGRLHRVYRGVYAVGHPGLSQEGRWMAATLAYGESAVLSHRSAAELWQLLPARSAAIHVTLPGDGGRARRHGIHLHRSSALPPSLTTRRTGIPVTKPARTLEDLRRVAPIDDVRRAVRQAEFLGLDLGDRAAGEPELTRSGLERRLLSLCRRHRLPRPEVNVSVGPYEVDFLWRGNRLIVETDGYGSHGGRSAFEDDRARDLELKLLGYEVVRFTYRQVVDQPRLMAQKLRALLA
jgi:very-short-patch-repair endonuclease